MPREHGAREEVTRLGGALNALVGISSLPARWESGEAAEIVSITLEALLGALQLAFARARWNDPDGGPAGEVSRAAGSQLGNAQTSEISSAIDSLPGDALSNSSLRVRVSVGDTELWVTSAPIGIQGELGVVVLASQSPHFPERAQQPIIDAATNQLATCLRQAHLLSEQKRIAKVLETELRQSYDHLLEVQRLTQTGSFTADLERDEHYWSNEFYRICEFEPGSKVTIERLGGIVHPEDVPLFYDAIGRANAGADPSFGFRVVTSGEVIKHLRGFAHRIADRPVFVGAIQDVSAIVIAEEALNKARSELAHVARITTLSALTASITHEVNQPLSGIITNASTCLRMLDANPPNIDGARETARRTLRDGNRATNVIERLRALFSKRDFTLESFDLNEATREVIALSSSDLQRNKIVLQSELADRLPAITADRIQLQQVMLNLFRNATDAMADVHDRPRQLLIGTRQDDDDRVRLTVRDTGVGIDPNSVDKLFDPFYTTKSGGMGIGLYVSRSIVELHHGQLWAEPNDGPGTTFSFSIPLPARSTADVADE